MVWRGAGGPPTEPVAMIPVQLITGWVHCVVHSAGPMLGRRKVTMTTEVRELVMRWRTVSNNKIRRRVISKWRWTPVRGWHSVWWG